MNICIISPAFPSEKNPIINIFIYRQAKALAEQGHNVFVVGGDTESRVEDNLTIYARPNAIKSVFLALKVVPKIPKESFWLLKNIGLKGMIGRLSLVQITCDLLKKEKVDIIDGHYADYGAVVAYLVSKTHKIKYVATCHGGDIIAEVVEGVFDVLPEGRRQMVSNALENAKCVIVPSQRLANDTKRYCLKSPIVVYNAVNLNFFKPLDKKIFKRRTVISIGALNKRKGHEYVLKAIPKVLEKNKDINFLIIGKGSEKKNLKRLVEELNISTNVTFMDFVPNEKLPLFYSSCEFFVLATLYDSFGIVFAEAMACGIPVVSTDVAAVPEVVGDGGILVEPRNLDQLTEAMLKLLNDENLRQKLSKKALEQAKKFSIERRIDKIEEIYSLYVGD